MVPGTCVRSTRAWAAVPPRSTRPWLHLTRAGATAATHRLHHLSLSFGPNLPVNRRLSSPSSTRQRHPSGRRAGSQASAKDGPNSCCNSMVSCAQESKQSEGEACNDEVEQEHGEHETRPVKILKDPRSPSTTEDLSRHLLSHILFRSWYPDCATGGGTSSFEEDARPLPWSSGRQRRHRTATQIAFSPEPGPSVRAH